MAFCQSDVCQNSSVSYNTFSFSFKTHLSVITHSHSLQSPNRIYLYRIYIGLLRYCRVMDSDSKSEFSDQEAKEGQVQEVVSEDQEELVVDAGVENETLMEDTVLTPQRNNRIECDSEHSRSCSEARSEVDLL